MTGLVEGVRWGMFLGVCLIYLKYSSMIRPVVSKAAPTWTNGKASFKANVFVMLYSYYTKYGILYKEYSEYTLLLRFAPCAGERR